MTCKAWLRVLCVYLTGYICLKQWLCAFNDLPASWLRLWEASTRTWARSCWSASSVGLEEKEAEWMKVVVFCWLLFCIAGTEDVFFLSLFVLLSQIFPPLSLYLSLVLLGFANARGLGSAKHGKSHDREILTGNPRLDWEKDNFAKFHGFTGLLLLSNRIMLVDGPKLLYFAAWPLHFHTTLHYSQPGSFEADPLAPTSQFWRRLKFWRVRHGNAVDWSQETRWTWTCFVPWEASMAAGKEHQGADCFESKRKHGGNCKESRKMQRTGLCDLWDMNDIF